MKNIAQAFHRQINSIFCPLDQVSTFSKLLILGIAMLFFSPDSLQAQINYRVTMRTGDNGADNTVWIRLFGTKSPAELKIGTKIQWDKIDYHVCDNPGDDRQAGKRDVYEFPVGDNDLGIITHVQLAGDAGRDWKLDTLIVERFISPGSEKTYPNKPFQSLFTSFNELIYRDWVARGADNRDEITPTIIEGTKVNKRQMFAYSGYKEALGGTSGIPKIVTTTTIATATKGKSLSSSASESTRNTFGVGLKTAFTSEFFGTEFSTELNFTSETEIATQKTDSETNNTQTSVSKSREVTNTFDKGFDTWVFYETVMDVEEYQARFLGDTYDMIKPYAENMTAGNTYEFKFGRNEIVPKEFEDIYLGKMVDKDAYDFLNSYKKPVTNSQVVQTSTTINGQGETSVQTYGYIEMKDGLHNKALIGGDTYNGSIYHQDAKNRTNAKWQFKPAEDGYYYIIDVKHNKALVAGDVANNRVYHQEPNARDNAKWKLVPAGDGTFHITDKKHGKSLIAGTTYDGNIYHQTPQGRKNATWKLTVVNAENGMVPTELK